MYNLSTDNPSGTAIGYGSVGHDPGICVRDEGVTES